MTSNEYFDNVIKILESYHYPELVSGFKIEHVAKSLGNAIGKMYYDRTFSPRMAAIVIWSMTMNYQIIPHAAQQVKH